MTAEDTSQVGRVGRRPTVVQAPADAHQRLAYPGPEKAPSLDGMSARIANAFPRPERTDGD